MANAFALAFSAVLAVTMIFIVLAFTGNIVGGISATQTTASSEQNISQNVLLGTVKISEQSSSLGLIVGLGILILVIIAIFIGGVIKNLNTGI